MGHPTWLFLSASCPYPLQAHNRNFTTVHTSSPRFAIMAARPILGLVSLVILAGGILLQFFTILSGAVNSSPENQFYFLEASNIGSIPNARNPSRWTFFAVCGVDTSGHNANCGAPVPALPFDPPRNFRTEANVPEQFIGTRHYYYLSRFMFAFYLIALFFAVVALFTGLLALCSRLGGYLSALNTSVALFFQTISATLMTAWSVQGEMLFAAPAILRAWASSCMPSHGRLWLVS